MNKKQFYKFVEELYSGKCPYCHRILVSETLRTSNGCVMCDSTYWYEKDKETK